MCIRDSERTDPALAPSDRVWTVPNALSFARLLGVPLFLWLILLSLIHI